MKSRRTLAALVMVAALAAAAGAAQITVGNPQASGEISAVAGNESATMSYNNSGDFLVAVITMSGDGGIIGTVAAPAVSFNGVALTKQVSGQRQDDAWAAIYYLADPATGSHTFSVDFGADVLTDAKGAWQFGVIGLSNVDETDPIAQSGVWGTAGTAPSDYTMTSPTPGEISAGDFVLCGSASQYEQLDPHWTIPTNSQTSFFYNSAPAGAGRHEYSAMYGLLAVGDLSGTNSDELVLDRQHATNRNGAYTGVVFNVIPEPATMALLGLGAAGLLWKRRRSRS